MEDFSLDDILRRGKGKPKSSKKRQKKGKEPTLGQEISEAIEIYDESMRQLHRPLTPEEKRKLEVLVNATEDCVPDPEDDFIVHKLLNMFQSASEIALEFGFEPDVDDEDMPPGMGKPEPTEIAFVLGMAYERLKTKGLL